MRWSGEPGWLSPASQADPTKRSPILLAGFAGGWFLNRPGLQVFTILPDSEEPWKRATVPFATSVSSWSAVMLAATEALRRTRLPVPIAAILLGGGVVVVDSLLADLAEARDAAKAAEAAEAREETDAASSVRRLNAQATSSKSALLTCASAGLSPASAGTRRVPLWSTTYVAPCGSRHT